jgi:nucleoside-diphosphate-sugar epimerase
MPDRIIMEDAESICRKLDGELFQDRTVLVTGASGLIGTCVLASLAQLKNLGVRVTVLALCSSEPPPHVAEIVAAGGFQVLTLNLADCEEYPRLPAADLIIHAAGYAQPSLFMANPVAAIQVNTSATAALLGRLRPGGRFLFVSSSEIYSGLHKELLRETDIGVTTPSHPRAAYIEGKRCGEAICNAFAAQGQAVRIARVALAYGPGTRKHDGRVMSSFIEKALSGDKIDLMDNGEALRTYCYVADTVELLWQILLKGKETVYNVGGRSTVTIAELARMVGELTGKPVVFPQVVSPSAGAPSAVRLDLSRTETEFGKNSYLEFRAGLERTIAWQRALYSTG